MKQEVRVAGLDAPDQRPARIRVCGVCPGAARPTCARTPRWSSASPCRSAGRRTAHRPRSASRRRRAQRGEKALSWTHVRPRREVRVAPLATTPPAVAHELPPDARASSCSLPAEQALGRSVTPRVVGRDVVGHVVEDQPQPAGPADRGPPPGPRRRRSARRRRSRARSRASRSRPRSRRSGSAPGCRRPALVRRGRSADRSGLRCQTPISHTASTGSATIASHADPGTSPSVQGLPAPATEALPARRRC